jgi:hypothetical protein
MPVDTPHISYEKMRTAWQRCRDAAEGLEAVRARGVEYLPQLAGQDTPAYNAYKKRADWYGATYRTIQGMGGAPFRKEMSLELPEALEEDWARDITLTGIPVKSFARKCLDEVLEVGRHGVYVDMAPEAEGIEEVRPYLVSIEAENIVDWIEERIGGKQIVTQVRLREMTEEVDPKDPFKREQIEQFRVLEIVDDEYQVQLWRKQKATANAKSEWEKWSPDGTGAPFVPTFRSRPLMQVPELRELTGGGVPFWFMNPTDVTPDIDKPPFKDLADLNLSLYRNSADLENALHYTGFPQPIAAGFPAKEKFHIGSQTAWVSNDSGAKAYYMEYSGQGLQAVLDNMARKKAEMAAMGARLLEEQKKAQEAAETVRLRQSGEQASLVGMIEVVETVLEGSLKFAVAWAGQNASKVSVGINKDLVAIRAMPQELTALNESLQAGHISYETYYHNLEQLEISRPGIDAEEEQEAIESDEGSIFQERAEEGRPAAGREDEIDKKVEEAQAA